MPSQINVLYLPLESMPFKASKTVFSKLLEVADVASLSREDRLRYDEALKHYRDYHNCLDYAEEKGIQKGMQKGRKKDSRLFGK